MYEIKNERGSILLNKNIIGNIAAEAAASFPGKVFLCNQKGKLLIQDPKNSSMMDITFDENTFTVRLYVMLSFGTSINAVTHTIIDKIYNDARETVGISPQRVTVVVVGMISKQIIRRHIEVSR